MKKEIRLAVVGLAALGFIGAICEGDKNENEHTDLMVVDQGPELALMKAKALAEKKCDGAYILGKPTILYEIGPTRAVPFFGGYTVAGACIKK